MSQSFFDRLPPNHSVRSITSAAARRSLKAEKLLRGKLASDLPGLKEQCAALVWVNSDSFSVGALEQLHAGSRKLLCELLGVAIAPRAAKEQAKRINDYVLAARAVPSGEDSETAAQTDAQTGAQVGMSTQSESGTAASSADSSAGHYGDSVFSSVAAALLRGTEVANTLVSGRTRIRWSAVVRGGAAGSPTGDGIRRAQV